MIRTSYGHYNNRFTVWPGPPAPAHTQIKQYFVDQLFAGISLYFGADLTKIYCFEPMKGFEPP